MNPVQELPHLGDAGKLLEYPVLLGPNARSGLAQLIQPFEKVVWVGDADVWDLHADNLPWLHELPHRLLPSGEGTKTWQHLESLIDFLAESGCSRSSLLLSVGGGVINDLAGLAASLYKRGMAVAHIPTTLLAQVDASVGGKTAINIGAGKNLAGTFYPPKFVLIDPVFLRTLGIDEWRSGMGEVVKTALLSRPPLWNHLTKVASSITTPTSASEDDLCELIRGCVTTKAQWVQSDPTERGSRKALNLGHTFGHAIEHAAGYGCIPHGVAVGMGLGLAAKASERAGHLVDRELPGRIESVLDTLGLPKRWRDAKPAPSTMLTVDALQLGLSHDKKGEVHKPRFVLPLEAGRVLWDVVLPTEAVRDLWTEFVSS